MVWSHTANDLVLDVVFAMSPNFSNGISIPGRTKPVIQRIRPPVSAFSATVANSVDSSVHASFTPRDDSLGAGAARPVVLPIPSKWFRACSSRSPGRTPAILTSARSDFGVSPAIPVCGTHPQRKTRRAIRMILPSSPVSLRPSASQLWPNAEGKLSAPARDVGLVNV